jgi:hypothetical protein
MTQDGGSDIKQGAKEIRNSLSNMNHIIGDQLLCSGTESNHLCEVDHLKNDEQET